MLNPLSQILVPDHYNELGYDIWWDGVVVREVRGGVRSLLVPQPSTRVQCWCSAITETTEHRTGLFHCTAGQQGDRLCSVQGSLSSPLSPSLTLSDDKKCTGSTPGRLTIFPELLALAPNAYLLGKSSNSRGNSTYFLPSSESWTLD